MRIKTPAETLQHFRAQGASRQGAAGQEGCNCFSVTEEPEQTSAIKPGVYTRKQDLSDPEVMCLS